MQYDEQLKAIADELNIEPHALAARLAKKLNAVNHRIIVRSKEGGLRIVQAGERLRLQENEFIANLPISIIRAAVAEVARKKGRIEPEDLDD
jgi:hypothetical protein